jgi:outer membrane protein TolC
MASITTSSIHHCGKRIPRPIRLSGSALRQLFRSGVAAGPWSGGLGKDQELGCTSRTQSGTVWNAAWDRPLIGPEEWAGFSVNSYIPPRFDATLLGFDYNLKYRRSFPTMKTLRHCFSYLPLGLLICLLPLSMPAESSEYQQDYQHLVDLIGPSEHLINPQDESIETAEAMAEMIRNYEIDLSKAAKKMTLDECISSALENNPDITRQFRLYEGLVWESISTRREWLPALTFNSPIGYRNKKIETYTSRSNSSSSRVIQLQDGSNLKPELKLSWSLLNLSRNSFLQSQQENIFSQELRLRQNVRELVLDVQSDYYDLQRARQEEDVYNGIYQLTSKLLRLISSRPLSHESDDFLAALKARSLQALSLRVSSQQNVIRLSASLASLLALPSNSFVLPSDKLVVKGRWDQRLNGTISTALERREEIKIAKSQSKASNELANSLIRKYIPELTAEAAVRLENDNYFLKTNTSDNSPRINTYTLDKFAGVQVKWNIFDGGVLAAQSSSFRKKALASQEQAALDSLTIEAQIKLAYSAYVSQVINMPVVKRELRQTLASLRVSTEQANKNSLSSITDLIQALDQYQSAAIRWFTTLQKYNEAIAQLHRYSSKWPPGVSRKVSSRLDYIQGISMDAGL